MEDVFVSAPVLLSILLGSVYFYYMSC